MLSISLHAPPSPSALLYPALCGGGGGQQQIPALWLSIGCVRGGVANSRRWEDGKRGKSGLFNSSARSAGYLLQSPRPEQGRSGRSSWLLDAHLRQPPLQVPIAPSPPWPFNSVVLVALEVLHNPMVSHNPAHITRWVLPLNSHQAHLCVPLLPACSWWMPQAFPLLWDAGLCYISDSRICFSLFLLHIWFHCLIPVCFNTNWSNPSLLLCFPKCSWLFFHVFNFRVLLGFSKIALLGFDWNFMRFIA